MAGQSSCCRPTSLFPLTSLPVLLLSSLLSSSSAPPLLHSPLLNPPSPPAVHPAQLSSLPPLSPSLPLSLSPPLLSTCLCLSALAYNLYDWPGQRRQSSVSNVGAVLGRGRGDVGTLCGEYVCAHQQLSRAGFLTYTNTIELCSSLIPGSLGQRTVCAN